MSSATVTHSSAGRWLVAARNDTLDEGFTQTHKPAELRVRPGHKKPCIFPGDSEYSKYQVKGLEHHAQWYDLSSVRFVTCLPPGSFVGTGEDSRRGFERH